MSDQPKSSRKRGKNFDYSEKEMLLECAVENKDIIDSKLTNQVTNIKKQKVWQDTQVKINALGYASRSVSEIKTKWNNMVQKAKKESTENKAQARKTGGGPAPAPISPISSKIIELYGDSPSFVGLAGVDSSLTADAVEMVTIVGKESSSPRSFQLVTDVLMTPSGDAVDGSPEMLNEDYARGTTTSVLQSSSVTPTTVSSTPVFARSMVTPRRLGTSAVVSGSLPSLPRSTGCSPPTVPARKSTDKKKKITHDDITLAQFEVLQLQKEKIILQKEKLQEEIKNFRLLNKKLERELENN